jgi:hypothetical protein
MPPKRPRKSALNASIQTPPSIITLGKELQPDPLPITPSIEASNKHTPAPAESSYPLDPLLLSNDTQDTNNTESAIQKASRGSSAKDKDDNRLTWTKEMHELLVVTLHKVFSDGGAADNSFKKATFQACVLAVRKAYRGSRPQDIDWSKCKNKWADTKKKWSHWVFLSKQSGFGFNPDTELYKTYDSVWSDLNKAHPKIIWHKTHVMPHREEIGFILHNVQANGQGALTLKDLIPIDPQLASSAASRSSTAPPKRGQTLYNKSKKRGKVKNLNGSDKDSPVPPSKKIDLRTAISSLSKEMERARKAKETYQTNQQKALKLLKTGYKERLNITAFIRACSFFKDKRNTITFITLADIVIQDQ